MAGLRSGRTTRVSLLLVSSLLFATSVAAQQIPHLPSGAEPGRKELQPAMPESTGPGQPIVVPKATAEQAPTGAEKFTFALAAVDITGATVFSADDLKSLYAGMIGKTVSVADMFKVANDVELRYRNAGYVTTRVLVPQQTIEAGHFQIRVVEGFVSQVVYPDDIGPAKAAVALLIDGLRNVAPINVADIERQLLLANDLPGLNIHAALEASPTELGASIIVVHAERKAFDASLTFDNRNTPYVGSFEELPTFSWNSVGAHADTFTVSAKTSTPFSREWFVAGNYQALLNRSGLTLSLNSSFSRSNPGENLDPLNVHSRVASEEITLAYPIIRSRLENLRAFGEFEYRDINTNLGGDPFNRDNLRILRVGLSYDRTDTWDGITAIRGTLHQGLSILNATPHGSAFASRADGYSDYTKVTAAVTRIQQLPANFSLFATLTGQISSVPLLSSEQIALGGPNFARGFDEGEISGDKGWAGSIELRYAPAMPKLLPNGVQFFAYFDGGQVWSESNTPLTTGTALTSIGGGVRANPLEHLFTTLEIDQPLNHRVETQGGKPTRVFFSLSVHY